MATSSLSVQPIGDFQVVFTPNALTGELVIDFPLAPNGDLATVTGISRLVQMVILWLLTPQGADPFDPTYGNPFYSQLGRPSTSTDDYLLMLTACENSFLTVQAQAAQAGQVSADEMVDHFADNKVVIVGPGQVVISFTIVARSGVTQDLLLPFASTLATSPLQN